MLPAFAAGALLLLMVALSTLAVNARAFYEASRVDALEHTHAAVVSAVADFHRTTGALPPSLRVLAETGGFEHLSAHVAEVNGGRFPGQLDQVQIFCVGFVPPSGHPRHDARGLCLDSSTTGTFDDGAVRYARAVIITPLRANRALSAYLSDNRCGSGSPIGTSPALAWCGGPDALNTLYHTNQIRTQILAQAQAGLAATADKLVLAQAAGRAYPLTPMGPVPLRSQVTVFTGNVGTSPATCWGSFHWGALGIAMDCSDLYTAGGALVTYERLSATSFRLQAPTPLTRSNGSTLVAEITRT